MLTAQGTAWIHKETTCWWEQRADQLRNTVTAMVVVRGGQVEDLERSTAISTPASSKLKTRSINFSFLLTTRHCVGAGESESSSSSKSCGTQDRKYDVPLRIGTLFVVLVTSAIGVFAPMLLAKLPFKSLNAMISTGVKQFGTGVIMATAFVHVSSYFLSVLAERTC